MRNVTSKYMSAITEMYDNYYNPTESLTLLKELCDKLRKGEMMIVEKSDRIIDYYDKEYREYRIDGDVEYTGETVQFGDIPPIKMR